MHIAVFINVQYVSIILRKLGWMLYKPFHRSWPEKYLKYIIMLSLKVLRIFPYAINFASNLFECLCAHRFRYLFEISAPEPYQIKKLLALFLSPSIRACIHISAIQDIQDVPIFFLQLLWIFSYRLKLTFYRWSSFSVEFWCNFVVISTILSH